MSDIVERLNNANLGEGDLHGYALVEIGNLLGEAAAEIERLRARLASADALLEHAEIVVNQQPSGLGWKVAYTAYLSRP